MDIRKILSTREELEGKISYVVGAVDEEATATIIGLIGLAHELSIRNLEVLQEMTNSAIVSVLKEWNRVGKITENDLNAMIGLLGTVEVTIAESVQ